MNNISYSEKSVASNVVIVLSTRFGTSFDQIKVICFSQGTPATFYRRVIF